MKLKILLILIFILIISACGNSSDKEAEKLNEQAFSHHKNHDLISAIEVYEKSLELKENEDVRNRLRAIKSEHDAVLEAKVILKDIENAKSEFYMPANDKIILEAMKDIQKSLGKLKNVKAPENTEIYNFIKTLKDRKEFYELSLNSDLNVARFQFTGSDVDISKYEDLVVNFLKMSSFIDLYK